MLRKAGIRGGLMPVGGIAATLIVLVGIAGCGPARQIEFPPPDTGQFLTLEQQGALGSGQLEAYCGVLNDYIVSLKEDIALSRAMNDSLSTVLDSLNAVHGSLNSETRLLENQLRRMKARRGATTAYTTRDGDTLMALARLFYGSPQEWRKLYEANRDAIGNPGEPLAPGIQLTVPR